MAAAVIAVGLLGCQAPGISRDEAITLAVRQIGPSNGPVALVSAVRQPASEAGSGYEWVVTFTGTFQGEGIGGQPPPIFHRRTIALDALSGDVLWLSGEE